MNVWPSWSTKKVVDTLSNIELQKTLYLVIQQKLFFKIFKNFSSWFEGLMSIVCFGIESKSEWIYDWAGWRQK